MTSIYVKGRCRHFFLANLAYIVAFFRQIINRGEFVSIFILFKFSKHIPMLSQNINEFPIVPSYVVEEKLLRRNLQLIHEISKEADVEFILAFKAFALWRLFPIFREYINHTTASSVNEAKLAYREFGSKAHTYSPAYEEETFDEILENSSHVTFNSFSQYNRLINRLLEHGCVSAGIRVNPEYSEIETDLYNPCASGSRFGVCQEDMPELLPKGIDGFHCHCHCESPASALVHTLENLEKRFGKWFSQIKWLNLGGGHLVTKQGYDVELLIETLKGIHERYPHLHIILEPGSAFAWQTGYLVSRVVDVVKNKGIKTAILNVSFTCHMPDCLEMPYWPKIRGAEYLEEIDGRETEELVYRMGGNSCLSGDFMGYWKFPKALAAGDIVIFEDMIHYTTVKTTMFNGVHHPAIILHKLDGDYSVLKQFSYEDYRDRMD